MIIICLSVDCKMPIGNLGPSGYADGAVTRRAKRNGSLKINSGEELIGCEWPIEIDLKLPIAFV
jgi:hypothetical protein